MLTVLSHTADRHHRRKRLPPLSIARIKVVVLFLIAVLAAQIFWAFLFRGGLPHKADSPAAQGLAGLL